MDGLNLLHTARGAGLLVWADGDRLVVRGPCRLEPLARQLLQRKPDVMAALGDEPRCSRCGSTGGHLAVAYWGPKFCVPCATVVAADLDARDAWPPNPFAPRSLNDEARFDDAVRELIDQFGAMAGEPYLCTRCGRAIEPRVEALEHDWSTFCGTCAGVMRSKNRKRDPEQTSSIPCGADSVDDNKLFDRATTAEPVRCAHCGRPIEWGAGALGFDQQTICTACARDSGTEGLDDGT